MIRPYYKEPGDLGCKQVAKLIGTTRMTVWRWAEKGLLKSRKVKVGTSIRYVMTMQQVLDFAEDHQIALKS